MKAIAVPRRDFGTTGMTVPALGLGAAQVGDADVADEDACTLLNEALDMGITLIDTARGYGASEERIGRHISHRRDEFVLSTKVGYGVDGISDWTGACVAAGINAALRRLRTGWIDIVHLHSCPLDVLKRGDVVEALESAKQAGKVRVAAYSGENEALEWAVESGRFVSVQCSVNICDQRSITGAVAAAKRRGLGVIGKRPLANAPWKYATCPEGEYVEEYWRRLKAMGLDPIDMDWDAYALRFAAYAPGVDSVIAGTARLDHLARNAAIVAHGPLPNEVHHAIEETFRAYDQGWTGQV